MVFFLTCVRFGSSSEAIIADRTILLPGTWVGTRAIMGSGALGEMGPTQPVQPG